MDAQKTVPKKKQTHQEPPSGYDQHTLRHRSAHQYQDNHHEHLRSDSNGENNLKK